MLLEKTFSSWVVLVLYIIWFCAIFLHLTHGFWSMFQTVGWNNQIWLKRLKVIGVIVAALIWLCFTTVAVNAFLHAHGVLPSVLG
jgi:succinate dehydrogenase / fumarate reductase cytochrome b subunit